MKKGKEQNPKECWQEWKETFKECKFRAIAQLNCPYIAASFLETPQYCSVSEPNVNGATEA